MKFRISKHRRSLGKWFNLNINYFSIWAVKQKYKPVWAKFRNIIKLWRNYRNSNKDCINNM